MSEIARSSVGDRIRAHNLAVAWIFSALAGAATISLSSGLRAARLLLPLFIMMGYLVYGLLQRTRSNAKLADSIYFLGFLWTLYALIDALVRHGADINSDTLFIVFGYALVTTALGMFLRLALIQFQVTLPDQLIETRQEIEERVAAFVGELNRAGTELAEARNHAVSTIDAWATDLTATTTKIRTEVERLHVESVRSVTGQLEASVGNIAAVLQPAEEVLRTLKPMVSAVVKQITTAESRFEKRLNTLDGVLERKSTDLERTLDDLATRIGNVRIPEDAIESRINSAWARIDPVVTRSVASLDGLVGKTADLKSQTEATSSALVVLNDRLTAVSERIDGLVRVIESLKEQSTKLDGTVVARSAEQLASAEQVIAQAKAMGEELQNTVLEVLAFVRQQMVEAVR